MDKQNNVFTDFCLEVQTVAEVAEKMFSLCDENGVLYIPEFGETKDCGLTFQKLVLKWDKNDVKNVIKECEKNESEIKEIFYVFGGTDVLKMEKEEEKPLPEELKSSLKKLIAGGGYISLADIQKLLSPVFNGVSCD